MNWMTWPIRHCLRLSSTYAAWVEIPRTRWTKRTLQHQLIALPEELVRPSPIIPNLPNSEELATFLRPLIGTHDHSTLTPARSLKRPVPISLVLPDLSARGEVLHFEAFEGRQHECEKLIRWRFQQDHVVSLNESHFTYQVYQAKNSSHGSSASVLALCINQGILAQYEALCSRLSLIPAHINIATLQLFNLWLTQTHTTTEQTTDDLVWVTALDGALTILLWSQGAPLSLRIKACSLKPSTEGSVENHARLLAEVTATLVEAEERHPQYAPTRIVYVAEPECAASVQFLAQELGLPSQEFSWSDLRHLPASTSTTSDLLSAYAGACAAHG